MASLTRMCGVLVCASSHSKRKGLLIRGGGGGTSSDCFSGWVRSALVRIFDCVCFTYTNASHCHKDDGSENSQTADSRFYLFRKDFTLCDGPTDHPTNQPTDRLEVLKRLHGMQGRGDSGGKYVTADSAVPIRLTDWPTD